MKILKSIDYTTMLGTRRSLHGNRLKKCPKCGKLGEVSYHKTKDGRKVCSVTHAGDLISAPVLGMEFFEVKVHCSMVCEEVA